MLCAVLSCFSGVWLCNLWTVNCQAPLSMDFPDKDIGMDCHFLFQGNFLTQESNPGLPHCRKMLYRLSQHGGAKILFVEAIQLIDKWSPGEGKQSSQVDSSIGRMVGLMNFQVSLTKRFHVGIYLGKQSLVIKYSGYSVFLYNIFKVQFSSVTQSCLTLCDPMKRSTPGLPVHHHLPEFTQTHIHQVSDAIQPSHPLLSPSPAPNPSQPQSL